MNKEDKIINFTRGVPPVEAFPTKQLQECAVAVLENHSSTVLQYHPASGYLPLREWLGEKYHVQPDHILLSNGSLQLQIFTAAILAKSGDHVLVEKPTYDRAITAFRKRGLKVHSVPLENDGYNVDALEEVVKEKKPKFFYIIPDFQNPTGITTSENKRRRLIELAETHDFWILEDNPYRELRYFGGDIPSIFSMGSEKVLFYSSFSKVLSPGIRVGYLIGPKALLAEITKTAEDTYITPNMLSQGMVHEYCQRGWLEPNIHHLRDLYRPRLETTLRALDEYLPNAKRYSPEGGFFVGVELPAEIDGSALRSRALSSGVKLSDGSGFYSDHSGDSFLRLPFCALTRQEIEEGVKRLSSLMGS